MNIVFVHDHEVNPSKGGMQRVSWLLAGELRRRGHSVSFLSLKPDSQDFKLSSGFPQYTIPVFSMSEPEFRTAIEDLVGLEKVDLFIFQHLSNENFAAIRMLPPGAGRVLVLHMQPYGFLGKERFVKRLTPWRSLGVKGKALKMFAVALPSLFRKFYLRHMAARYLEVTGAVDRTVLLSDRFRPRLVDNTPGIDATRICAIPNPLTFPVGDGQPSLEGKQNLVLVLCRITNTQKNITGFIDAWKKFHASHPDWEARIVGDGADLELVKRYARRRGVGSIRFEGNREDVERYYREAKIFCLTSTFEGWGMVLVEAMAFGCVPVAFDSYEALRDIVADGENGLIVPPFSAAAMAAAMARLADNPDLWRRLALQGPASIRRFGIRDVVDEWEDKILNRL